MQENVVLVTKILTQTFDALTIEYMIGGSLASSVHGLYRYTNDVDIVADVREAHIAPLVAALEAQFYIDADMIRDAIQYESSFNVIYLEGMIKADIFIRQKSAWVDMEWSRRRIEKLGLGDAPSAYVASPEDMILQKLRWFRLGGSVSDRQWGDITGMLKVQQPTLDYAYLKQWAAYLTLTDLLALAYDDSGIDEDL
jgi:hypothetical protein